MPTRDEFAFANDIRAAREQDVPRAIILLLVTLVCLAASVVGWAWWAVLDEVTTAEGQVVPAQKVQVIQSLEGGILLELLVEQGDVVEQGQIILRFDNTVSASKLGELNQRRNSILARLSRLSAEAESHREVFFDPVLQEDAEATVLAELELFAARQEDLEQNILVLRPQLAQRRQELNELGAKRDKFINALVFLEKELVLTRKLRKKKAIAEIELLQLERRAAEAKGELNVVLASFERIKSAVKEYENRLVSARTQFRSEARSELATETAQLGVIEEALDGARERVKRTEIKAPVRGIVNSIAITTIGGVLQPGAPIMEIVPIDDKLLIEARIRPQDVAFIQPGQSANVKLSAYDYSIYGALEGEVILISPNTIANENGETFYRVIVETADSSLTRNGRKLDILPGMVATVDIQTGQKTVLEYLLKPVRKLRNEALRER